MICDERKSSGRVQRIAGSIIWIHRCCCSNLSITGQGATMRDEITFVGTNENPETQRQPLRAQFASRKPESRDQRCNDSRIRDL